MQNRLVIGASVLFALMGCRAPDAAAPGVIAPEPAHQAVSAPVGASEPPGPQDSPPDNVSTEKARRDVLERLLGPSVPAGWKAESAYDLGSILMATVTRSSDAQPVTVFSVTEAGAGFSQDQLASAFSGAAVSGPHPLEVLGYDLVQPRGASTVTVGAAAVPSLDYAWLRVDPDSGARDNGSGSAIWLRCGEPGARGPGFLLLSSEMPAGRYDAARLGEFAAALEVCGEASE